MFEVDGMKRNDINQAQDGLNQVRGPQGTKMAETKLTREENTRSDQDEFIDQKQHFSVQLARSKTFCRDILKNISRSTMFDCSRSSIWHHWAIYASFYTTMSTLLHSQYTFTFPWLSLIVIVLERD